MNTLWRKVWADLWRHPSRSILAICSIAAGIVSIGILFGMIDLQLAQMDAAHLRSQPSQINLILRQDADLAELERIRGLPGVAGVEAMTQLTVRYRLEGQTDWSLGTLMVRLDYPHQHFDRTVLQSGHWPSVDGLAVENLSAQFTGLQAGDAVELETRDGSHFLPIVGVVRHPFVKPPGFGGQVHFFADATVAARFGVPAHSFRQLLVQITEPYSADRARDIARDIRNQLGQHAIAVNVSLLQDPQKHWGRPIFAGLNQVLQIMALASLALSSVLVFNTVTAHIRQQTDEIGVMKALGARHFTIAKIYLSEILLMALAAICLALPISLVGAQMSSCKLLALFNIQCEAWQYSPRAVLFMILGGLLAPLLAALVPIWRGAAMPVREALASYGLGSDFGSHRLDVWVEAHLARFLPTLNAAALGNLLRRKGRFLLTQAVLIIAGVTFLVLMSLIASVNETLDQEMARSRYTLRLGFSRDQPLAQVMELAKSVAETGNVEFWRRLPLEWARNGETLRQKGSLGAQMLALPSATRSYAPRMEQGRWLQAEDAGKRVLVISADTAGLNGIQVGDSIDLRLGAETQAWQVIGLYRWLAGSNFAVEPVYAPLETLSTSDRVSFALLDAPITQRAEEDVYVRAVKQAFQDRGIALDVYTTQAKLEQRQFARNQFRPVISTLLGLASMIAAVGGIGLSGTLAIGVLQRTREIGVLRAIGAPSRAIFRMFLLEGVLHGLISWTLSLPLAYLAAEPISRQLGMTMLGIQLDFLFNTAAVFYWLGIVLLLTWSASYWPARKAAGMVVRESLG